MEATEGKIKKLTREEIEARLANEESLENLDLSDLDLAGFDLEGQSFRGADVRGLKLFRPGADETQDVITNIDNSDWLDATVADESAATDFFGVSANGATFGFSESLRNRRARLRQSGVAPGPKDCGGYYGFMAGNGDFKNTQWQNIDFGGGATIAGSDFGGADLSGAVFTECDLSQLDLSGAKIDGIKILNPVWLKGLTISEKQISALARAIELADPKAQKDFLAAAKTRGEKNALQENFGIVITAAED